MLIFEPLNGKRIVFLFLILFGFTGQLRLFSKKAAILPELMQPHKISTTRTQLYIADKWNIFIYSLDTFKLTKKFGKKGEGPGEFKLSPIIKAFSNVLAVSDMGKFMLFSMNGQLQSEHRLPPKFFFTFHVYPTGSNFVGFTRGGARNTGKSFYAINFFDKNLNFVKELARGKEEAISPGKKKSFEPITDYFRHTVYKDRIYVADSSKGLFIEVFDSSGAKLYTIDKKYEKIKITDQVKHTIEKEMDSSQLDRMVKKRSNIVYKEYFPAIQRFIVNDGKIYVFTYKEKDAKQEVVVMDLKGNIQKKAFVTKPTRRRFSISNNTYYYLLWNETAEEWELHLEAL